MSRWTESWRLQFEKVFREEADGSFLIRPFGIFGRPYALPDRATKNQYIARRIIIKKRTLIIYTITITIFLILLFAAPSAVKWIPTDIFMFIGPSFLPAEMLTESAFAWRMLRTIGGRPVPRDRWHGARTGISLDAVQDPFSSAESGQLGGIFLLLVALSALLASILLASYFGPPGRDAGMPYLLFLLCLMITGTLAVAIWRELWLRERRSGSRNDLDGTAHTTQSER